MEWKEEFKLGIATIDAQHKELIMLLNKFQQALQKGDSQNAYANTIRALVEYTKYHFTDEESYMQSINYPKFNEHKQIHLQLISKVKNVLLSLKERRPVHAIALMRFLNDWVCTHILDEDLKISRYIQSGIRNQVLDTQKAKLFGDQGEVLITKFHSLIKQREQKSITEDEYYNNCNNIMMSYIENSEFSKLADLQKVISLVSHLVKNNIIDENGSKRLNFIIVKMAINSNIATGFNDKESIIRFLNSLKNDNVITGEDCSKLRNEVL